MELEEIRKKIDEIDHELVKLIDERFTLIERIIEVKNTLGMDTFQPKREEQVIAKVRDLSANPDVAEGVFRAIIEESKKFQERFR